MKRKLSELVTIQIGYQHRERVEPASVGTHRLMQVKDVVTDGRFSEFFDGPVGLWTGSLYMVTPKGPGWKYQVTPGDVLFVAKGSRNFGIAVTPRWVKPFLDTWDDVLASSQFYILRPNVNRVLPDYLAWSLNQPTTQGRLQSMATGTHMKMIPKSSFEELLLDVPSIEIQEKIVTVDSLAAKERQLLGRIAKQRLLLVQTICQNAAKGIPRASEEN